MSGGIRYGSGPWRMTLGQFVLWFNTTPDDWKRDHIKINGKPIVRVPVERQVPNEADL